MQHHLAMLGHRVRDKVTGFEGVVSTISFDLYGCVQAIIQPPYDNEKKTQPEGKWMDTNRLEALGTSPVMAVPSFDKPVVPGPAEKPAK